MSFFAAAGMVGRRKSAAVVGPTLVYNYDFENDFTGAAGVDAPSSTIITTGALSGSKSARVAGGTAGWGFQYNLGGVDRTEFYQKMRIKFNITTNPSGNITAEMLKFGNGTNWQFILSHALRADGTSGLAIWNAPANVYTGSGTTQLPRGESFELDVYIKIAANGGRLIIRVNGAVIHDFTGNTGTLAMNRMNVLAQTNTTNANGAVWDHVIDDIQGALTGYPVYGATPPVTPPSSTPIIASGPNQNLASAGTLGFATPDTDFTWYNGVTDKADRQQILGAYANRSDLRSNRTLASYDSLINAVTANDQWMIGLIMGGSQVGGADIENLDTQARRDAFITWAVSCVNRWGAPGTGQIEHWQILNELNLNDKASPEDYALLMPPLYDAMKAADPNCFIITNGLSSVVDTAGDDLSTLDWTNRFMTALPANRRDNCFDAWAQQPYTAGTTPDTAGAWQAWNQVDRNYDIMKNTYGVKKQVWLTEYGDPTAPSGGYAVVSEAAAAANIEMAYYRACRTPWLGPVLIYSERDRPTNNGISSDSSSETFFGVTKRDGSQKPAAAVYQTLAWRDAALQIGRPASGTRTFWAGRYFKADPDNFDLEGATYSMTTLSGVTIASATGMLSITSGASTGAFTVTATLNGTSAQVVLNIV